MTYRLAVEPAVIHTSLELTAPEKALALAIGAGIDPSDATKSVGTKNRLLRALKEKGVIEEGSEAVKVQKMEDIKPYILIGSPLMREINPLIADRDKRLSLFVKAFNADAGDEALRKAWSKLEIQNGKHDHNSIPEIAYVMPAILKGAQLQLDWQTSHGVQPIDAVRFIKDRCFENADYSVKLGEPPPVKMTDIEMVAEGKRYYAELMSMNPGPDQTPVGHHVNEAPYSYMRRMQAKLEEMQQW